MATRILLILGVLGFLGLLGAGLGYLMSRAALRSARQRKHLLQLWGATTICFLAFVIPALLLAWLGPTPQRLPGLWTGLAWWLGLGDALLVLSLLRWGWQWWRDLVPAQTEADEPTRERMLTWVGWGTATPTVLLVLGLFGLLFHSTLQVQRIPTTTVERIVTESKDAKFTLFQARNGSRQLQITLPGRPHSRFDAPADAATLELLTRHGVAYKTVVQGQDRSLDLLGGTFPLLWLISLFFGPAGLCLLLVRPQRSAAPLRSWAALKKPALPAPLGLEKLLLAWRTDAAFWKTFGLVFAVMFLLAGAAAAVLAFNVRNSSWYASTACLQLARANAQTLQQEIKVLQSDAIQDAVITRLDLNRKWSRFNHGRPLQPAVTKELLRRFASVRTDYGAGQIQIYAYGEDRAETARLANTIAEVYLEQHGTALPAARWVSRATPAERSQSGNLRVAVLIVGAFAAGLVGLLAGGGAACVRAWRRGREEAPAMPRPPQAGRAAFTLLELLVVIAIISVLASLLLPALSRAKQKAQGTYCLNNGKQMMIAITLYTGDNKDFFPPNPDDGNTVQGHNWCGGQAGRGQPDEFNPELLKDPTRSLLTPFLSGNTAMFHCPGDRRQGFYQGSDPAWLGRTVPAARTFSMSQAVGTICESFDSGPARRDKNAHAGAPTLPVNGPWLNNQRTHRRNAPWLTYSRLSAIAGQGPAMLWVLVDEDERGLNDAAFAFGMEQPFWLDAPGTYHNGGCGFAFADGHSELHRWLSRSPKQNNRPLSPDDRRDWLWMRERTSAHIDGPLPPPR